LIELSFKERKYNDWRKDSGTDQLLRSVLPATIVDEIKSKTIGGLRTAIELLENQFLAEAGLQQRG
jgi:hypothetical protein